jgi:hypothetical protein
MLLISCMIGLSDGTIAPLVASSTILMVFGGGLFLAWIRCGSDLLPGRTLMATVPYIVSKLPDYARMLASNRSTKWVRTDRSKPD